MPHLDRLSVIVKLAALVDLPSRQAPGIHGDAADLDAALARDPETSSQPVRVDRIECRRALVPAPRRTELLTQTIEITPMLQAPDDMAQGRPRFYGAGKLWIVSTPNDPLAAVQRLEVQTTVGLAYEPQAPVEEKFPALIDVVDAISDTVNSQNAHPNLLPSATACRSKKACW